MTKDGRARAVWWTAALALVLAVTACGHRKHEGGTDDGDETTAAGLPRIAASKLYATYAGLEGADRLSKFGDGVVVTGVVHQALDLGHSEGLQLQLAIEGEGHVALTFEDDGDEARKRRLGRGDKVAARCELGGKPDDTLYLVACVLQ